MGRAKDSEQPIAEGGVIVQQSLGGKKYEIDPSRNKVHTPLTLVVCKSVILTALSPVLVVTGAISYAAMSLSPSWITNRIHGFLIPRIMKRIAELFEPERRELLRGIEEGHSVLDVGCGGGAYLRHFTKASRVVALEPVTEMHAEIRGVAKQAGIAKEKLTVLPLAVEEFVASHKLEYSDGFDWIILGNVLCEVPNPAATLEAVAAMTKKGGHIFLSEHEGEAPGTWSRSLRNFVNPWWVVMSGGCNCNRDTLTTLKSSLRSPEWEVLVWPYPHVRVWLGPSFLALCRKN